MSEYRSHVHPLSFFSPSSLFLFQLLYALKTRNNQTSVGGPFVTKSLITNQFLKTDFCKNFKIGGWGSQKLSGPKSQCVSTCIMSPLAFPSVCCTLLYMYLTQSCRQKEVQSGETADQNKMLLGQQETAQRGY